jgi:hypothetical protein
MTNSEIRKFENLKIEEPGYSFSNFRILKCINWLLLLAVSCCLLAAPACTKTIDVTIPDSAEQIVVEGTIENNVPPVVILTKSQKFFGTIDLNNLGNYFVHGAQVTVTGSDGTSTPLVELCLQGLNLPQEQQDVLLNALGFSTVDSANIPNVLRLHHS